MKGYFLVCLIGAATALTLTCRGVAQTSIQMVVDEPPVEIIYVPHDLPTIQSAVDAIAAGGRVVVAAGTYYESVRVHDKHVQIVGEAGAEHTIIDATGLDDTVVRFYQGGWKKGNMLRGVTLRGGNGTLHPGQSQTKRFGGGVYAVLSDLWIESCIVEDNHATNGGGIYGAGSELVMHDTIVRRNRVTNSNIPGGGLAGKDMIMWLDRCRFEENEAIAFFCGGAIGNDGSYLFCRNTVFLNNHGRRFGAIRSSGIMKLANCTFVGNRSELSDATSVGLLSINAVTSISNTVFFSNDSGVGKDVTVGSGPAPTIINSYIRGWTHSDEQLANVNHRFRSIEDGDLDLLPGSDLIGAGSMDALDGDLFDVALRDRVVGLSVDIGAYEFQGAAGDPEEEPQFDPCAADLTGDGRVDIADLLAVLSAFGNHCGDCPQDIDGSGAVELGDLLAVMAAWGPCPE